MKCKFEKWLFFLELTTSNNYERVGFSYSCKSNYHAKLTKTEDVEREPELEDAIFIYIDLEIKAPSSGFFKQNYFLFYKKFHSRFLK